LNDLDNFTSGSENEGFRTGVSAFSQVSRLYYSFNYSGPQFAQPLSLNVCFSRFRDRVIFWKFSTAVMYIGLVTSSRSSGKIHYNYKWQMMFLTRQRVVMGEYM
jgi:hypothetical protein